MYAHSFWNITAGYFSNQDFPEWIKRFNLEKKVSLLQCDLTQEDQVKTIARKFDVVIHLAANGDPAWSVAHPEEDFRKNALSTKYIVQHLNYDRLVYFSSGAVYDGLKGEINPKVKVHQPKLPYAVSNLAAESFISNLSKKERGYVIVRFFGAYGPHEPARKIYTKLVNTFALEKKNFFTIRGNGSNLIDAMYVEDTCEIIRRIAEKPIVENILDVGCGCPLTLKQLVEQAAAIFNIQNLDLRCEGNVPEYIEFRMNAEPLRRIYDFKPKITLQDGLMRLETFYKD